jgi:hypothetical protein
MIVPIVRRNSLSKTAVSPRRSGQAVLIVHKPPPYFYAAG